MLVYKPCTPAEINFYEQTNSEHPDFARLMPTFLGTLQNGRSEQLETTIASMTSNERSEIGSAGAMVLSTPELEKESTNTQDVAVNSNPLRGKRLDTDLMIVLENVAAGFKRPNIIDIKLGKRLWADDAPPAKRARLDDVASKTTSGPLGFRVAGMQVWEPDACRPSLKTPYQKSLPPTKGAHKSYDKIYGRQLTPDTVKNAFSTFLCLDTKEQSEEVVESIISGIDEAIGEIEDALAEEESRMYSASILMVYEGDAQAREEAIAAAIDRTARMKEDREEEGEAAEEEDEDEEDSKKLFDVKLIDFAHAAWTPGEGPDENVLFGLRNVRRIVDGLGKVKRKA